MSGADVRMHPHLLKMKPAGRHLFRGQWLSVPEISERTGISKTALYKRIRRGAPLDIAGRSGRAPKVFLFRGKMMTAAEIAHLIGVDQTTVYQRVSGDRVLEQEELDNPNFPRDLPEHACLISYKGKTLTKKGWARELGIPVPTFRSRYRAGWSMERIATEPVMHASLRGTLLRNRRIITRLSIGFRRDRNTQLIHRISTAFRTGSPQPPGYMQTSTNSQGTGVGRRVHDLQQNLENSR